MTNLRYGRVSDADYARGLYRMSIEPDGIVSHWLPVVTSSTVDGMAFSPLQVGERVAAIFDENVEDGVILGSIYTPRTRPEGTQHRTFIEFEGKVYAQYDASAEEFEVSNGNTVLTVGQNDVTLRSGVETLGGVLGELLDAMIVETHTSAAPGSPTTPPLNAATYAALKTRLQSILG